MRILLFGAGYSAQAYAKLISSKAETIHGTTRAPEKFVSLEQAGITPLLFDGKTVTPELTQALNAATHIVISIAPGADGDPALKCVEAVLGASGSSLQWIAYLSTVGVYGDHQGQAVDENTACKPTSNRSTERVDAEAAWLKLAERHDLPLAILRLSGIYGPGRNAFINLQRGTAKRIIKPAQVFNRIHVADIASALDFLGGNRIAGVFNITDNEPAPPQDVVTYAAHLMNVAPPAEIPFETADMTAMAHSFYSENKRVSNERIRELGFQFTYPDYRSAFTKMWHEDSWH